MFESRYDVLSSVFYERTNKVLLPEILAVDLLFFSTLHLSKMCRLTGPHIVKGAVYTNSTCMDFYLELHVFGAVPVRKRDDILD